MTDLHGGVPAKRKERRPRGVQLVVFAVAVIGALVFAGSPAETLANPVHGESAHSVADLAGNLPLALALIGLGTLGFLGTRRRWRRLAVLALIGLLGVFAVETALHSVHHLGDPHAIHECAVSAASAHVNGVCVDAPGVVDPTRIVSVSPVVDAPVVSRLLWFRPDEGRAPPVAPAS